MKEHILTSPIDKARGVIGRYPDENERYVFPFDMPKQRGVHMIGVNKPLQVSWYLGEELVKRKVLRPWIGHGAAVADMVIEEPAHV